MFEGQPKQFQSGTREEITPTMLYAEQHKQEAEQYNKKWRVWLKLSEEKSPEDIAYEKALLENEGFDIRQSAEYKEWGKVNEHVFAELREKRDRPAAETEHIRPLIYFGGGAMLGAIGAAQAELLHQAGLGDSFTTIIGNSAGSGTAAYFAAGGEHTKIAASLFANECTTKEFLGWKNNEPFKFLDATVIAKSMRQGPKALNENAVRESKANVYVLATNRETGGSDFLDMKQTEPDGSDMVTKLEASSAITIFRDPVVINGTPYSDGAYAHTSIEEMIKKFNPTSILIIPNESFRPRADIVNEGLPSMVGGLLQSVGATIRQKVFGSSAFTSEVERYLQMHERGREFIEELYQSTGVKLGVMWAPTTTLGALSNNQTDVRVAIADAFADAAKQLGVDAPSLSV